MKHLFRRLRAVALWFTSVFPAVAVAGTWQVSSDADLRQAIAQVNSQSGTHFIEIRADITLTSPLPPLLNNVTIKGFEHSINANGTGRHFLIGADQASSAPRISVALNNLSLIGGRAQGGSGTDGGGGGLGAGGALFVNQRADVVLTGVDFSNNQALGGHGGIGTGGGGGGMGGDGGSGGGGLSGAGGSGAGGGGGALAAGGDGGAGGGGGAGLAAGGSSPGNDGSDGDWSVYWDASAAGNGAAPLGGTAGSGGASAGGGGAGASDGGGGGGGVGGASASGADGGNGGLLGGGGGAVLTGNGGNGGFAGGGGGAVSGDGGQGGFAGGGGGSQNGAGGDGGFGGGGGSGVTGGTGGFGAGGGAGGAGGIGGGGGVAGGGGGGAGLGGSVFVAEGGSLSLGGAATLETGSVQAGSGVSGAADGVAEGSGIFLQGSGTLELRGPLVSDLNPQLIIEDDITDAVGAGLAGAAPFDRWNLRITGADIRGEVHLRGENYFSGDTLISGSTLVLRDSSNLGGSAGAIVLDYGGLKTNAVMTLTRDMVVNSGGALLSTRDETQLDADITGDGKIIKEGQSDLVIRRDLSFSGDWDIRDGFLSLDRDQRLGGGRVHINGSAAGFRFADNINDMRGFDVGPLGAELRGNGHDIHIVGDISGTGWTEYLDGHFYIDGDNGSKGSILYNATVTGDVGAGASLQQDSSLWQLGGSDALIGALSGRGAIELGANVLTISSSKNNQYEGVISGSGSLVKLGGGTLELSGISTWSGGTRVEEGIVLITRDENLGTGNVDLVDGGIVGFKESYVSQKGFTVTGGGLGAAGGSLGVDDLSTVRIQGDIDGSGHLGITGRGFIILEGNNTYAGDTIVSGEEISLGIANENALGGGVLRLGDRGALRVLSDTSDLRPIILQDGGGTIDTVGFDVVTLGDISGMAPGDGLFKRGSGSFTIAGDMQYLGGTAIEEGVLQLGQGGAEGTLLGDVDIAEGATFLVNRSGTVTLDGEINGGGKVIKTGSGLLQLSGTHYNLFTGGLTVEQGEVGFDSDTLLGVSELVLSGGGLLFGSDARSDVQVDMDNGSYRVTGGDSFVHYGDTGGDGRLAKQGGGQLVLAGEVDNVGGVWVSEGELQVGLGLRGSLDTDVQVDAGATLSFNRNDVLDFEHDITGEGDVVQRGDGELVFARDQFYQGATRVENGTLRLGLGGTSGSVAGDIEIFSGASLVFDRSDSWVHAGDIAGAGQLLHNGSGNTVLTGTASHTGGTLINAGAIYVGNGGTAGELQGDVTMKAGSTLAINRSDAVTLPGGLDGNGDLVQMGSGVTTLTGANSYSGNTWILDGYLEIDSDARLGSSELVLNGGGLRYGAAFDDLRDIKLAANDGSLDTNGFDVGYVNTISGPGALTKTGNGSFRMTGILSADRLSVDQGQVIVGDGNLAGTLLADLEIRGPGSLAFDRADTISYGGVLTGDGTLIKRGAGSFSLALDNNAFTGRTVVEEGSFRLDRSLGGDMDITGGSLLGAGDLVGDLAVRNGAVVSPGGTDIAVLSVGGDLLLESGSIYRVDARANGTADRILVGGDASVAGEVQVRVGDGDFSSNQRYRIVQTGGGVSGTFGDVSSDLTFLTPDLEYGGNYVDLILRRNSTSFVQVSLTQNQRAVAGALDQLPSTHEAVAYVEGMDVAGALRAYDSFSGDSLLAATGASSRLSSLLDRQLQLRTSRLGSASRGAGSSERLAEWFAHQTQSSGGTLLPARAASSPVKPVEGLWLETQNLNVRVGEDENIGNAEYDLEAQTTAMGLDGYWSKNLIIGAGFGSGTGDITFDNRDASGELSTLFGGIYGRWDTDTWHAKFSVSASRTDAEISRSVVTSTARAQSDQSLSTLGAELEVGQAFHAGNFGVRPFAVLRHQSSTADGFRETGAGAANLVAGEGEATAGEYGLGAEVSRPWLWSESRWAQLEAGVTVLNPYGDGRFTRTLRFQDTSVPFRVGAADRDETAWEFGVGGEFYFSANGAMWLGARNRTAGEYSDSRVLLGIHMRM